MVVHHANGLHHRVDRRRADEAKAAALELARQRCRLGRARATSGARLMAEPRRRLVIRATLSLRLGLW
jgi:hypothetical protein